MFGLGLYLLIFILHKFAKDREHYTKEQFTIGITSALMVTVGPEFFLILFIVAKYKWVFPPNNAKELAAGALHVFDSALRVLLGSARVLHVRNGHRRLAVEAPARGFCERVRSGCDFLLLFYIARAGGDRAGASE